VDALEYVRSRHGDILSDIARSQKQQQLLLDIKSAAKTLGLADVPSIASSLGNSLKTDMQLTQVASLLPLAKAFSSGNITQVIMLSQDYSSVTESDGEQALAPNWTAINALVAQYFPA
jgi:anionic cell wall polymer biosynthesis LytR-Cps2A-Psr (LCP) family protein